MPCLMQALARHIQAVHAQAMHVHAAQAHVMHVPCFAYPHFACPCRALHVLHAKSYYRAKIGL
jgi:hypothetical protein